MSVDQHIHKPTTEQKELSCKLAIPPNNKNTSQQTNVDNITARNRLNF